MALEQTGVQLVAAGSNIYITSMQNATTVTNNFVGATEKGGGRVSAAGQVMIGALRKVGEIAVEAFGKALQAGAKFIGDSISVAADFEQTMNVLGATTGATGDELTAVSKKAKDLGNDLSLPNTSAVDAGEAMLELAKAGFTVEQAMDAAKGTLQLAAAAQIDEAKAAEITSNAINAFGLSAKDANKVADLLAASANASSVEITDVADSYQMAGAVFSTFQGPVVGAENALVDLTTAVGILGNVGIKGSDAGTSLKQAILQLTAPSDKAKGIMQDLAASIGESGDIAFTANGQMRSFKDIIGLTAAATAHMTDEERSYAITTIFGADASRSILALIEQGPDAWDKMRDAVTKTGAAQDLATAQTKGLKGAWAGVQSQIETLQLTIGQALTPILTGLLVNVVQPLIGGISAFADSILGASDPVLALAQSLNAISPALSNIAFYIVELVRGGAGLSEWLQATPGWFQTLVGAIQAAIPVVQSIAAFVGDNLTPILFGVGTAITVTVVPALISAIAAFTAAAAPIVALIAVGALLYKAWETDFGGIRTTITEWWDNALEPAFEAATDWMSKEIPKAVKVVSSFFSDTLVPAMQDVWSFLKSYVFPVFDVLINTWFAVAKVEVQALATLWTSVLWPALNTVWSFISGTLIPIMSALFRVEFEVAKLVVTALAGIWQNVLQPALSAVGSYLSATLGPALTKVSSFLSDTFSPALSTFSAWWTTISGGIGGVSGAVQTLIGWLNDLADKISNIKLPDWATPGSPTPFEIGLRGMGDALKRDLNPQLAIMLGRLMVSPAALPAQIAAAGTTNYYNGGNRSLSMPVYTNMSAGAIYQSAAIANALL